MKDEGSSETLNESAWVIHLRLHQTVQMWRFAPCRFPKGSGSACAHLCPVHVRCYDVTRKYCVTTTVLALRKNREVTSGIGDRTDMDFGKRFVHAENGSEQV